MSFLLPALVLLAWIDRFVVHRVWRFVGFNSFVVVRVKKNVW